MPILIETVGIWGLYWVGFVLGLAAFGLFDPLGASGSLVAFSVTATGMMVPAVGAVGPYHQFGKVALTDFYGVAPDLAFACITVLHAVLLYVVGGLGGVAAWIAQLWVMKRRKAAAAGGRGE
jgi:hypothetical protein